MQINISGHHVDVSQALRDYIEDKLSRIDNHHDGITNGQITLKKERNLMIADATVQVTGQTIHASGKNEDMYAAIDELADRLDRQIRHYKSRLSEYR